jgi:hypothetical protein
MKKNFTIQLKASFLLVVFSLNIICWGCPAGLCMCGKQEATAENKSVCKEHKCMPVTDCCHKKITARKNSTSKGCRKTPCNDNIVNFSKIDKNCTQHFSPINNIFFTTFISSFSNIDVLKTFDAEVSIKNYLQKYHPPIPDIRVAIRSFQI